MNVITYDDWYHSLTEEQLQQLLEDGIDMMGEYENYIADLGCRQYEEMKDDV